MMINTTIQPGDKAVWFYRYRRNWERLNCKVLAIQKRTARIATRKPDGRYMERFIKIERLRKSA